MATGIRLRHSLLALGLPILALGIATPARAQDTPRGDVSAGYQAIMLTGDVDETLTKGWYADAAVNLTPLLGIVFEVGGAYKSISESLTFQGVTVSATADVSVHEFMGGLRLNAHPGPTVTPFGQVLFGAVRGSADASISTSGFPEDFSFESDALSSTELALQVGGGADIGLSDGIGIRGGMDYLRVFVEDEGLNAFRFRAGIVFRF
jgi:opacity protein-like surface antigen